MGGRRENQNVGVQIPMAPILYPFGVASVSAGMPAGFELIGLDPAISRRIICTFYFPEG
jgi:hypothetical protein